MRLKHAAVPAAALALSFGALMAPAQAATQHCEGYDNKHEVDAGPEYDSELAPGTPVCVKAGNQVMYTTVGAGGLIVQDEIKNKPGNAYLGISYYAWNDECEYDCEPES